MTTWIPVASSAISAIAYEPGTLRVRFRGGGEYVYERVSRAEFLALLNAQSRGRYLNLHIKPSHQYRKIS